MGTITTVVKVKRNESEVGFVSSFFNRRGAAMCRKNLYFCEKSIRIC